MSVRHICVGEKYKNFSMAIQTENNTLRKEYHEKNGEFRRTNVIIVTTDEKYGGKAKKKCDFIEVFRHMV